MDKDYIYIHEQTPRLLTKKCKYFVYFLYILLKYTSFMVALFFWWHHDYFIAGISLMLSFIVMGIVQSKLRQASIPMEQQEFQYSDLETAQWITKKLICN